MASDQKSVDNGTDDLNGAQSYCPECGRLAHGVPSKGVTHSRDCPHRAQSYYEGVYEPHHVKVVVEDLHGRTVHWDNAYSWTEARRLLRDFQDANGRLTGRRTDA